MSGNAAVKVYLGADGPNPIIQFTVKDNNGAVIQNPFFAVTHATLYLYGIDMTIDSRVTPDMFDWSLGSGKIQIKLGSVTVPKGGYRARLKVYDSLHEDGQVLTHERGPNYLLVEFV